MRQLQALEICTKHWKSVQSLCVHFLGTAMFCPASKHSIRIHFRRKSDFFFVWIAVSNSAQQTAKRLNFIITEKIFPSTQRMNICDKRWTHGINKVRILFVSWSENTISIQYTHFNDETDYLWVWEKIKYNVNLHRTVTFQQICTFGLV